MSKLETYFDFAQDDFNNFFYQRIYGIKANSLGALAQSICERYLKHIVMKYADMEDTIITEKSEKLLKTHNLDILISFIKNDLCIDINRDVVFAIKAINGLYFTTRYPGEESFTIMDDNIEECETALVDCRNLVIDIIREKSDSIIKDDFELSSAINDYIEEKVFYHETLINEPLREKTR